MNVESKNTEFLSSLFIELNKSTQSKSYKRKKNYDSRCQ